MHGSVFCQGDADALHVQQVVQDEVDGLVGQGRVAHGGADALEAFGQQVGDGQVLVRSVAPGCLADVLVHLLCGGFGQAVAEGLDEQVAVGVARSVEGFKPVDGRGEQSHRICLARRQRPHKVAQAEVGSSLRVGFLLAQ